MANDEGNVYFKDLPEIEITNTTEAYPAGKKETKIRVKAATTKEAYEYIKKIQGGKENEG